MDARITSTISLLEVLWTLFGLIGLVAAIRNTVEAFRDDHKMRKLPRSYKTRSERNALRTAALGQVVLESTRVLILLAISGIGILALLTTNASAPWTTFRYTVTISLLVIPVIVTFQSIYSLWLIRKIRLLLDERTQATTKGVM